MDQGQGIFSFPQVVFSQCSQQNSGSPGRFKVQVPMVQTVQKMVDVPQIEIEEQIVEVPVQKHVRVPMIQKVQKMVEVPQIEVEEKIVEVPVQSHVQVPMIQKVQKVVEAGLTGFHFVQSWVMGQTSCGPWCFGWIKGATSGDRRAGGGSSCGKTGPSAYDPKGAEECGCSTNWIRRSGGGDSQELMFLLFFECNLGKWGDFYLLFFLGIC